MTALIEPARTFCGVPFCGDPGALAAEVAVLGAPQGHALLRKAGRGEIADEAVLV